MNKTDWIKQDASQLVLIVNLVTWVVNVETGLKNLKGNPQSMKKTFEE